MLQLRYILILLASLIMILTGGCGEEEKFSTDTDSIGGGDPGDGDGDGDDPVVASTFKVNINSSGWLSLLHKNSGIAGECQVDPDATAVGDKYIDCYFNVQELSFFFNEIDFTFEVPKQMCRYVRYNPYVFYNWRTGIGPSEIWIQSELDGAGEVTGYTCAEGAGPHNPATMASCDTFTEWSASSGSPSCTYNYSLADADYPNCCAGSYILNTRDYDGTLTNEDSADASWGLWGRQCFGGAASRDAEWPITKNGYPRSIIYATWNEGLSQTYKFASPISLVQAVGFTAGEKTGNVSTVNDYTGAIPTQLDPAYTDLSGDDLGADPREDYEIECLDEGDEVKFSINIKFRDWNTSADYDTYVADETGSPNVTGVEGVACAYEDPDGGLCNDYSDWDDFVGAGNPYPQQIW